MNMRLAWVSILAFSSLWLARWPLFPIWLDPAYHLLIARQLIDAGGPFTYEWWQAAPAGRPHVYPPVLHLVIAGLLKLGVPPITSLQLLTVMIMPCVLVSVYLVMRRLFSPDVALLGVWAAIVPYGWVIQVSGALASGLAVMELLWLMVAVHERRMLAAAGLLALMWYTHLGLPWVAVASLLGWSVVKAVRQPGLLCPVIAGGACLGAPWLAHLATVIGVFRITARQENQSVEIMPALWLLAIVGARRSWQQTGAPRLLIGLWLGFCVMAHPFLFRWISGEGMLPVILLAAYGMAVLNGWLARWTPHAAGRWLILATLGMALIMSPTMVVGSGGPQVRWFDSTPFHLLNGAGVEPKGKDLALSDRHLARVADRVAALTRPSEILWSNSAYGVGLIAALAHRATSSAMLYEVAPKPLEEQVAAAHWVVWFKFEPLPDLPSLAELMEHYRLVPVEENDVAILLRNPRAAAGPQPPRAIIPFWLAFVLLCCILGLIGRGWRRRPHIAGSDG